MSAPKRLAMVCASNQNRSMETHCLLQKKGYSNLSSFGTNSRVKIPGPSVDQPLVYEFGTPYEAILEDMKRRDEEFYTQKGMIQMIKRNMTVKQAPERFQDNTQQFDIIVSFEERVFDIIVEYFDDRRQQTLVPVVIFNFNVPDTHESATVGANDVFNLLQLVDSIGEHWLDHIDDILEEYQLYYKKDVIFQVAWY